MQRFLKDTQHAPLFNPMPQSQPLSVGQPVNAIPATASHGRLGSPFSSNEPSKTSVSAEATRDAAASTGGVTDGHAEGMGHAPRAKSEYEHIFKDVTGRKVFKLWKLYKEHLEEHK